MTKQEIKLECVRISTTMQNNKAEDVVRDAKALYDFIEGKLPVKKKK